MIQQPGFQKEAGLFAYAASQGVLKIEGREERFGSKETRKPGKERRKEFQELFFSRVFSSFPGFLVSLEALLENDSRVTDCRTFACGMENLRVA